MTGLSWLMALASVAAGGVAVAAWLHDAPRVFRFAVLAAAGFAVAAWGIAGVPGWRPLLFAAVVMTVVVIAAGLVVIGVAERLEPDEVPTEEQP